METRSHKKAQAKYDARMKAQYRFRLNKNTDDDIIQKLESVPSKQAYVRALIERDLRG